MSLSLRIKEALRIGTGLKRQTGPSIITDWEDSGVTLPTGSFGTLTDVFFKQRRVGNMLRVKGYCTVGTVAASIAEINLPPGLSIDTSLMPPTIRPAVGWWFELYASGPVAAVGAGYTGFIFYQPGYSTTKLLMAHFMNVAGFDSIVASSLFTSSQAMGFDFEVPILQWR